MNDWKQVAVNSTTAMKEVLSVIDRGGMQIALVVDDGCHLLGTVTDGDIRRALLRGEGLDTPVSGLMNANPVTGLVDEDEMLWQRTMQRHALRHLPLLDPQGCVVGLARYEPPTEPRRDNPVVLMAGGLGTRLRPLTNDRPKPLVEVGTKPILETIIENFVSHGFHRFYLCINYMGEMIREHFDDGSHWGVEIEYVEEPAPLGTAGALGLLPERPTLPFFVMNGDVLTKVDFVRLLEFHQRHGFDATLCVREYHQQIPYGVVETDGHRVSRLVEKPVRRYHVNAGIYVLNPQMLERIPEDQFYDMPMLFETLVARQRPVGSFPLRDYWIDIGQMEHYQQAETDFAEHFQ
ncbi:nucleotidyltransferase family protein [Thiohalobacter sp. IOR34]|uniref:nucleotidyltransferase family protein n=1 Tax=Thiohalobacter sp. IOR34 TaxID=3057176 RepID=UPI0025AF2658|nr:nucleotidyltransferase family protein [Thiohalobacter sp. IOR34]WJW74592.1 nucleotidyltransferase family protein [Thiohalobacter sp. IOR34]